MNYVNRLLEKLNEWNDRLENSSEKAFPSQLSHFVSKLEQNPMILGYLNEIQERHEFDQRALLLDPEFIPPGTPFESMEMHASFAYQSLKFLITHRGYDKLRYLHCWTGSWDIRGPQIMETLVSPIVFFLRDILIESSSIVYLLEKYKKRVEWFTRSTIVKNYLAAEKNFEKLLEDDLRLFLFDQGIDYPFSTPASPSGRADIVGQIDTDDPLVLEIKIIDSQRKYGKSRIGEGFRQIVEYTNDYHKAVGYLVIFNFDDTEIDFGAIDSTKMFPPRFEYANKEYNFIVVDLFIGEPAR